MSVESLKGKFVEIAQVMGDLVERKNAAYGSSFEKCGDFLKLLYPDGLSPEQYVDALLVIRIFDKQMRIAHNAGAFGESPYRDIIGYGLCGAAAQESRSKSRQAQDAIVAKEDRKPRLAVVTSVLITNDQGELLVGIRKNNTLDGMWSTPGGRVEERDTWQGTAVAETHQEAGLLLKEEDLILLGVEDKFINTGHYVVLYVWAKKHEGQPVNCEPDKCEGWYWKSLKMVQDLTTVGACTEPLSILGRLERALLMEQHLGGRGTLKDLVFEPTVVKKEGQDDQQVETDVEKILPQQY